MISRIYWTLWRRHWLRLTVPGFSAAPTAFASRSSRFEGHNRIYAACTVIESQLGRFSYVSRGARVVNSAVGRFCSIGPEALVGGLGVHPTRWLATHPVFYSSRRQTGGVTFSPNSQLEELPGVTLGHDVWIGARAIVLDGISIGSGAVVAAGTVVTEDVPPYAIVGGVPARIVRKRFDEATIERLLRLQWWTWPVDRLRAAAAEFAREDVESALRQLEMNALRHAE
jgi:chloramphenicol O-acetyltransferase type B